MSIVDQLSLARISFSTSNTSKSYRPPSWPPPKDWVCIEDSNGNPISRWGDPIWDLSPWIGKTRRLNFGDGPKVKCTSPSIDAANAYLLRLLMTWKFWGPRGGNSVETSISNFFDEFRKIVALCSRNNILLSDISRYPAIVDSIASIISPSKFKYVLFELALLYDARELLCFTVMDKVDIARLKSLQPNRINEQTEYIPLKIWAYQVTRLKECMDDYLAYQSNLESLFKFCIEAYEQNYRGSYEVRSYKKNPFHGSNKPGERDGMTFYGAFIHVAEKYGVRELLEKWIGKDILMEKGISALSSYFTLTTNAGLAYVMNFTLMRKEECASIRANCLIWHEDEKFGKIPLVQGETTKTDPDKHALWIASPSIENAIKALRSISLLRISCFKNIDEDLKTNPYLFGWAGEPWSSYSYTSKVKMANNIRPTAMAYSAFRTRFKRLFDPKQLIISDEDLKIARMVCPTINAQFFKVGVPWPFAWHQLRRTVAVNMFASGMISDSSMQLQMKHLSRMMPLYYGKGNSSLRFTDEIRVLLVNAQYEEMGRQFAMLKTERFISPYGEQHKKRFFSSNEDGEPVNLISNHDANRYEKAARNQQIRFRLTVLGACMKDGRCDHDSFESVSECGGGSSNSPCPQALFDRERSNTNKTRLDGVKAQLAGTTIDTPKYRALEQERKGLENYFAYINHF